MSQKLKSSLIISVLLLSIISLCVMFGFTSSYYLGRFGSPLTFATRIAENPTLEPVLAEYTITKTEAFVQLWTKSNVFVVQNQNDKGIVTVDDKAFFVGTLTQKRDDFLFRMDLRTGKVDWQIPERGAIPYVFAQYDNLLFVSSGVPTQIIAYDIMSGDVVWDRSFSFSERRATYMSATESSLYVNTASASFYTLDTKDGRIKDQEQPQEVMLPVFSIHNNTIYHRTFNDTLVATNEQSGNIIWEREFDKNIVKAPLFTNDKVVIRTGERNLGQLFVLDIATGQTVWQSAYDVTSNVTIDNDIVYYLTEDSHLNALDLQTGEKLGEVEFTPSLLELEPLDKVNGSFFVAANNNTVVVYFGTGRQLFAFRFLGSSK